MAAYRCSTCAINYPTMGRCRVCDEPTDFLLNAKPDDDWQERVERATAVEVEEDRRDDFARRSRNLLDLGFSADQVLYMSPERPYFDWHEAERLLREGNTHARVTYLLGD